MMSSNRGLVLSGFLLSFASLGHAASGMDILTLGDRLLLERLAETKQAVMLILPDGTPGEGTGVSIAHLGRNFLLTNAHVVKQSTESAVMILNSEGKPGFVWAVLVASDAAKDTAILVFSNVKAPEKIARVLSQRGIRPSKNVLDSLAMLPETLENVSKKNTYLTDKFLSRIDEVSPGLKAYFLGFPLGIGASLVVKDPVVRSGTIATKVDGDTFFLDAMINHGNSGSPVLIPVSTQEGDVGIYSLKLVGLLSGFKSDYIDFKSEDGQIISLPHNSGLSRVISIKAYLDLIDSKYGP